MNIYIYVYMCMPNKQICCTYVAEKLRKLLPDTGAGERMLLILLRKLLLRCSAGYQPASRRIIRRPSDAHTGQIA